MSFEIGDKVIYTGKSKSLMPYKHVHIVVSTKVSEHSTNIVISVNNIYYEVDPQALIKVIEVQ